MEKNKKNYNNNNFNGTMNFNGLTQIATGDIINNTSDISMKKANYTPEPKWRSPFTMAVLTWISVIIGIAGVFPFGKLIKSALNILRGDINMSLSSGVQTDVIFFIIFFLLFVISFRLRKIAKNQTRNPLFCNFAINGYGGRLVLEKIHIDKCPQCGGKMKYYNKPVEWREVLYSNGKIKRQIVKKVPALECKRNAEHWCKVDPAEDRVK